MLFRGIVSPLPQIQKQGSAILRQTARPLAAGEISSASTRKLMSDMWKVMEKEGGCGIAAPQLGVPAQLVALELPWQADLPHVSAFPRTVLINPRLRVLPRAERLAWPGAAQGLPAATLAVGDAAVQKARYEMWESCLSVPNSWGRVLRHAAVAVSYLDEQGRPRSLSAWGYLAGMLQHELDHLAGALYVDRALETCTTAEFHRRFPPDTWRREFGALGLARNSPA
jgi:peptide deformylase